MASSVLVNNSAGEEIELDKVAKDKTGELAESNCQVGEGNARMQLEYVKKSSAGLT